ncbi:hypothetical protein AU315_004504, partial [Escherichia coli]|nr:hypothetical protein [Escherichia coli]
MKIYTEIQKKLTEYRTQQRIYWDNLQQKLNSFETDLVSYLGVGEFILCDKNDKRYSIVTVGVMDGNNVK